MTRVLIVDDDPSTLASISRAFRLAGHEAVVCDNAARAVALIRADRFDIVFSDVVMPGKDGLAMLAELREIGVTTPVVMISGQATVDMAVRATRLGAVDFLEKPVSADKLLLTIENALKLVRLEDENRTLRRRVGRHEIIGKSDALRRVMAQVNRVAATESRVCILGETGTGKELVARAVHDGSPRRERPFVTVNCAAVPSELIESELFGHEKGSFTGAASRHLGKFEQAHGGTLFLDEIGDMPAAMQAKLLRLLQEGELERIGGERPIVVDTRVLAATHRDLEALVGKGSFREDLYHRIFVFPIVMPPLRERVDDVPVLAEHFAARIAEQNGWKARAFMPDALTELTRYNWPGNVRELRNVVERLLLLTDEAVDVSTVRQVLSGRHLTVSSGAGAGTGTLADRVAAFEREAVVGELAAHGHRMTETARALGIERSHLYKKCQQLGIDLKAERTQS
ncbi:MAG: sigma-54-dependent Fis family transcriptional regulator [Acidobacteria bacterium]|nr:MAG: sigma-54-dependent Fis family transcriptional regulator [Acidobacteriota bacterium]